MVVYRGLRVSSVLQEGKSALFQPMIWTILLILAVCVFIIVTEVADALLVAEVQSVVTLLVSSLVSRVTLEKLDSHFLVLLIDV